MLVIISKKEVKEIVGENEENLQNHLYYYLANLLNGESFLDGRPITINNVKERKDCFLFEIGSDDGSAFLPQEGEPF